MLNTLIDLCQMAGEAGCHWPHLHEPVVRFSLAVVIGCHAWRLLHRWRENRRGDPPGKREEEE
jgi:hypothetical protein